MANTAGKLQALIDVPGQTPQASVTLSKYMLWPTHHRPLRRHIAPAVLPSALPFVPFIAFQAYGGFLYCGGQGSAAQRSVVSLPYQCRPYQGRGVRCLGHISAGHISVGHISAEVCGVIHISAAERGSGLLWCLSANTINSQVGRRDCWPNQITK